MLVIRYAGFGALGVTTHISIVANKVLLDAAVVGSGRVILGRARVLVLPCLGLQPLSHHVLL